ncbi:MAG: T9SS type A sorting domain-containing protein, partial [Bacteroidales bacterium]
GDIDNTTVGETEVTYTMNEGNTCEVSESFTVYVVDDIINMDITPEDITVCQGETIEFPSGNGVFDPASVDNSTPGSTTVTYYLAQGTDCENSATFDVTVLESPDAPVELSENHVLSTTAGGELQWYFEGDTIDGATDLTYTCTEDGDYYLVVTASNGCSTQSDVINVTGTDVESNNVHDFKIYPNPAREKVFVELPQKPVQLTVYDITGKTLLKNNNFSSGVIDISGFHQGIYMIKMNIGNQYGIKKLIIK